MSRIAVVVLIGSVLAGIGKGQLAPVGEKESNPSDRATESSSANSLQQLGKVLFWDEQLSSTRTVACGTCHQFRAGGVDPRVLENLELSVHPGYDNLFGTDDDVSGSRGVPLTNPDGTYELSATFELLEQVTRRKSRSIVDLAQEKELYADGRVSEKFVDPLTGITLREKGGALEQEALLSAVATEQMAHLGRTLSDVADRVSATRPLAIAPSVPADLAAWIGGRSYTELFADVFDEPFPAATSIPVTPARIAIAIAAYERTLNSSIPLDDEETVLTEQEQLGQSVFAANCASCHAGSMLTDQDYHYIGVRPDFEDEGRYAVTQDPMDLGAIKTPSLRNVELRAPYMHNGRFSTLEEVIEFYDRGGDYEASSKDPRIIPLNLSGNEKEALAAFLRRPLTDQRLVLGQAPFDRPALYTESEWVPEHFGAGSAGAGDFVPHAVAYEPGWMDNPLMTIGVMRGRPGARAFLCLDATPATDGIPFYGMTSHLELSPLLVVVSVGELNGTEPGTGYTSVSLPLEICPDNGLETVTGYAQWLILDDLSPGGVLSASEGLTIRLFD